MRKGGNGWQIYDQLLLFFPNNYTHSSLTPLLSVALSISPQFITTFDILPHRMRSRYGVFILSTALGVGVSGQDSAAARLVSRCRLRLFSRTHRELLLHRCSLGYG